MLLLILCCFCFMRLPQILMKTSPSLHRLCCPFSHDATVYHISWWSLRVRTWPLSAAPVLLWSWLSANEFQSLSWCKGGHLSRRQIVKAETRPHQGRWWSGRLGRKQQHGQVAYSLHFSLCKWPKAITGYLQEYLLLQSSFWKLSDGEGTDLQHTS